MTTDTGHLDAIAARLGPDLLAARIVELEQALVAAMAEAQAEIDRLRAAEAQSKAIDAAARERGVALLAAERRMAALETDRAARLEMVRRCETKIGALEREGASRRAEIHRLTDELVVRRAEMALPMWKRIVRRLTGKLPSDASAPARGACGDGPPAASGSEAPEAVTFRAMSTDRALWRCARRGVEVATIVDVGASNGMWSEMCERHFPKARQLLVEAQEVHRPALERHCAGARAAEFVLAAAGARGGEIWFDDRDPFGGLASETRTEGMRRKVPVVALDDETTARGLEGPFLLKLDVHGFEVPILEGAKNVLSRSSLVVIECYTFRVAERSLLFHEMVAYLRERGFGVIDASEPLWRVRDACFWQLDLVFAPLSRPEFAANTWS